MKSNNLKNAAILFSAILILGLIINKIVAENYKVNPDKATEIATNQKNENGFPLQKLYVVLNSEQNEQYRFIDVRSEAQFELSHISGAVNIPFNRILTKDCKQMVEESDKTNVFYAENESKAADAFFLLRQLGYENIKFMQGGFEYAKKYIMRTYQPSYGHFHLEKPKYDFTKYFNTNKNKSKTKPEKPDVTTIEVSGGC